MIEKFEKKVDIKTSVTNSQNALMSEKETYKIEGKNPYESLKGRNKESKKIIIMNDKDELYSANSKRSNENILLLKKNKYNILKENLNEEYIDKVQSYYNTKSKLYNNKLSTEEINNDATLSDYDNNEIDKKSDIEKEEKE